MLRSWNGNVMLLTACVVAWWPGLVVVRCSRST